MLDPYKEAKLEKLKQLKKLMYELMAEEGMGPDEEMPESGLHEAMEAAEEESMPEGEDMEKEDSKMSAMEELRKMKEEYFKPKVRERRPGTAIMFESISAKPMMSKPAMSSKKGKYK